MSLEKNEIRTRMETAVFLTVGAMDNHQRESIERFAKAVEQLSTISEMEKAQAQKTLTELDVATTDMIESILCSE